MLRYSQSFSISCAKIKFWIRIKLIASIKFFTHLTWNHATCGLKTAHYFILFDFSVMTNILKHI